MLDYWRFERGDTRRNALLRAVAYGNGRFVAVMNSGAIYTATRFGIADVLHDVITRPREVMMDVVHVRPSSS